MHTHTYTCRHAHASPPLSPPPPTAPPSHVFNNNVCVYSWLVDNGRQEEGEEETRPEESQEEVHMVSETF